MKPESPATLLFLNPDPRLSAGCNISMLRLIEGLDRTRFTPVVAAPRNSAYAPKLEKMGVALHDYQSNNWWFPEPRHFYRHLAGLRERVKNLVNLIETQHVDLVYTNAEYAFEGGLAAALTGKPHVWAQRVLFTSELDVLAHFPLSPEALFELMLELSDRIVSNSHDVHNSFPNIGASDQLTVIESSIALPAPTTSPDQSRLALRNKLGIPPNSRIVLAVGRISPEKDLLTWLRVATKIPESIGDNAVHFVHIGEATVPPYFDELAEQHIRLGLHGRVHFMGAASPEAMADLYQAADVFTLTSTRFEGFARVAAEAMLSGLPVISTRCGGVEDYIDDARTGYLCAVGDDHGIATRLLELLHNPVAARTLGEHGRQSFLNRYSASTLDAKWETLFSDLINNPRPPRVRLKYEMAINLLSQVGAVGLCTTLPDKTSMPKRMMQAIRAKFRG